MIIVLGQYSAATQWLWFIPVLLFILFCNSIQFSAMNTITIGALQGAQTSSGNSLMAVNQQMAIGLANRFGAAL